MAFADYIKAAIPEPYTILGLRLKPFSLGHYLTLRKFNNAFVSDSPAPITLKDLVFAVLVSSMSHDDFLEFVQTEGYETKVKEWGQKIGIFDYTEKVNLFQEYLSNSLKLPNYFEGENSGDTDTREKHWVEPIYSIALTDLGYTNQYIMNRPLSGLIYDVLTYLDSKGVIELFDESVPTKE